MTNRTFKQYAVAAGLVGALSLAAVTPSSARWGGGHWGGPGVAIGAGIAGLALGAAAASSAAPYYYGGYGGGYNGYYDYAPAPVVVAPGPGYYPYDPYPGRRRGTCRFDVRAC
jgi:hypothetical protein